MGAGFQPVSNSSLILNGDRRGVCPTEQICTSARCGYIKAMKMNPVANVSFLALLCLALAFVTGGCKTTTAADWNSRVGTYTYNQAVLDLGPPSKQINLKDGRIVAQWITLHGNNGFAAGGGFGNGNYGMGAGQTISQSYKDHVLELTFGPDGKLVSWAKNY